MVSAVYAGLGTTVTTILVNHYIKPSLHTGSLSAIATAAAFFSPPVASALFLMTVLMAWSRVELGEHDLMETIVGALIPLVTITAVFLATGAGSQ